MTTLRIRLADVWRWLTRTLRDNHWAVIGLLWVAAAVLGYNGFARHAAAHGLERSPLDLIYLTLQLIPLNSGAVEPPVNVQLNVARLLVPALTAFTLWQAIAAVFREQLLFLRLWRLNSHVVICGLSRKGWLLTRGFLERGDRVVVIEEDEQNDLIQPCRERGAIVLIGDATDPETLKRAAVCRAGQVIAVTSDDGANAEIALRCDALLRREQAHRPRSTPLICTVHLVDPQLTELARAREMAADDQSPLHVEMFNTFDRGGQLLWQTYRGAIIAGDRAPHLLVVGLGRLGESLVVHAARDWYERMKGSAGAPGRMRITVIDKEAGWKRQALHLRYPRLADACDVVGEQIDVRGPEFVQAAFLAETPGCPGVDAVFVCFDDDSFGLRTALAIHHHLRQNCTRPVPVIVRMAEAGGLSALLDPAQDGNGVFANLHAFGLLDQTCRPNGIQGTHEILARTVHDYYTTSRQAAGDTAQNNSSLLPWEQLPESLRRSNLAQVDGIYAHLHALGYTLEPLTDWEKASFQFSNDEAACLAEMEHERYVAERLGNGWKVGPKDNAARTNPSLIPWAQLPDSERQKNLAFARALPAILARAGFQIAR